MSDRKIVFVAFAIEDENMRDLFTGQRLHTRSPFEFIDYSVKTAYESNWKEQVRTRIRRAQGVIALISKNSLSSSGQQWEIACAREENKPILAMWIYGSDRTVLPGTAPVAWSWDTIAAFIDRI